VSVREIKINHPGDGDWIMLRVGGVFNDKTDHTVAVHRDGRIAGGMVYTGYLGSMITMHVAGSEDNWVTRDFLWMIFHYAFVQLGCRKVLGLVAASNHRSLKINKALGWRETARIYDAYPDGSALIILTMDKTDWQISKWGKLVPKRYRSKEHA
jgi:hypothetical protein